MLCQQLVHDVAGQDPAAPSPTEAATNTKHTSDLLRRFKELTVKEPKDPAAFDQPEIDLRVSPHLRTVDTLSHTCITFHVAFSCMWLGHKLVEASLFVVLKKHAPVRIRPCVKFTQLQFITLVHVLAASWPDCCPKRAWQLMVRPAI